MLTMIGKLTLDTVFKERASLNFNIVGTHSGFKCLADDTQRLSMMLLNLGG